MINIGLTIIFHREGALAVPALASMADMVVRTAAAGVRVETRAILDRPDHDTHRIVRKSGVWLDDIVTVEFGDLGASRNEGTRLSSCSHLAFLDGDDMWGADWLVKASASAFAAVARTMSSGSPSGSITSTNVTSISTPPADCLAWARDPSS